MTQHLAVLQVGFTLWIAYGFALGNAAIVVPPEEEQHGGDAELPVRDGGDVAWFATEHDECARLDLHHDATRAPSTAD